MALPFADRPCGRRSMAATCRRATPGVAVRLRTRWHGQNGPLPLGEAWMNAAERTVRSRRYSRCPLSDLVTELVEDEAALASSVGTRSEEASHLQRTSSSSWTPVGQPEPRRDWSTTSPPGRATIGLMSSAIASPVYRRRHRITTPSPAPTSEPSSAAAAPAPAALLSRFARRRPAKTGRGGNSAIAISPLTDARGSVSPVARRGLGGRVWSPASEPPAGRHGRLCRRILREANGPRTPGARPNL